MSVLPVGMGSSGVDVGDIGHSLRLRAAASAYLSRTWGASTDYTKCTYSLWVKRTPGTDQMLMSAGSGTSSYIYFSSDTIAIALDSASKRQTTAVYRDPTAWYHIVVILDTGNATDADRLQLWVNGVRVTSWAVNASITLNSTPTLTGNGIVHNISRYLTTPGQYLDGYLSRVCFIDGQALTPSSFGYQNTEINEWVSKSQSQVLAVVEAGGTNSFMLDFDDATSLTTLGYDKSTKNNDWTLNNVSLTSGVTYDHMLDVPGNSYCTLNPLDKDASVSSITDGNLKVTGSSANYHAERSAMAIPAGGKWSGAFTILGSSNAAFGLCAASVDLAAWASGATANAWIVDNQAVSGRADLVLNGATRVAVTASGVAMLQNSVGKWAYDADTGKLWLGDSAYGWYPATLGGAVGDPAAGTNPTATISTSLQLFVFSGGYGTTGSICADFGQQGYTPPTGFLALCQANLPEAGTVTVSGSFTGNAAADGPFVWMGGVPLTLTINGNAVTFGTHADKTAGGFKLRTSSASYNTAGSNTWTATITSDVKNLFKYRNAQGNP